MQSENESGIDKETEEGCCISLTHLMQVQKEIIEESIEFHKWCNKFPNETEAIIDFIKKFGWLMRKTYCKAKCEKHKNCKFANTGM